MQFILLTCFLSWAVAGVAILLGLRVENVVLYTVFAAAYMWLPSVCAIILQVIHKEKPFRNLYISFRPNWWFLVAGITPIFYAFLTLGLNLLFPNVSFSFAAEGFVAGLPAELAETAVQQLTQFPPFVFLLMQVVNALIAGYTINAVFAFGEELGWRGYLLRELKDKKFLHVSLITGVVWGSWHFPLILLGHNYPEHSVAGVGMMIVWCVLLSPVMTYIMVKSKSVITAAIFHGSLNAIAGISGIFLIGGNDLTNGVTGIAGFIALLLLSFVFYLYDKCITKESVFTKTIGECLQAKNEQAAV
jgi:membrane protease YdiL (CAAX protease family)